MYRLGVLAFCFFLVVGFMAHSKPPTLRGRTRTSHCSNQVLQNEEWNAFREKQPAVRSIRILNRHAASPEHWRVSVANLSISYTDPQAVEAVGARPASMAYTLEQMALIRQVGKDNHVAVEIKDRNGSTAWEEMSFQMNLVGSWKHIVQFVQDAERRVSGNPNFLRAHLDPPASYNQPAPHLTLQGAMEGFQEAYMPSGPISDPSL